MLSFGHEFLHIPTDSRKELKSLFQELSPERLGDIPRISYEHTSELLCKLQNGGSIIDISGSKIDPDKISILIGDDMKFESIKPSHS